MTRQTKERLARSLALAVAEFDDELVIETFGDPSASARRAWRKAKRRRGRPRKGRGVQIISLSIEQKLLEQSDALAKRMGLSRTALFERGLKAVLAAQGQI